MGTLVVIWLICGVIAAAIGKQKGRGVGDSFMFGLVLGPLGIILVAVLAVPAPRGMRRVVCSKCNAAQNIPNADQTYDCWQCHHVSRVSTRSPE